MGNDGANENEKHKHVTISNH